MASTIPESSKTKRRKHDAAQEVNGDPETPEALLNDVVLEVIFKYLDYKDLKSCRQVGNTTWLRNSKKAWYARTKVVLTKIEGEPNPIMDYLNHTEINTNATNYKLDNFREAYFGFWERIGHSIKELELTYCNFRSQDEFRQFIYTQCANLEKIVITRMEIEILPKLVEPTEWQQPQFGQQTHLKSLHFSMDKMPVSWMELLSHFPNLQTLEVWAENAGIFKAITMIRQHDPKMLKLKHIDIRVQSDSDYDYDMSIRPVLLDRGLLLETISINSWTCQPETTVDVLNLHANYLKKLRIEGSQAFHPVIKLPQQPLQNLKQLFITDCYFPASIFKYTPNVQKVCLRYNIDPLYNLLEGAEPLQVNTCKELMLFSDKDGQDIPLSDFEFYINTFPNVEIFGIREINNHIFSLICERWPKLVSLKNFYGSEVDGTRLLGYDPDSKANNEVRKPNITHLKGENLQICLRNVNRKRPGKEVEMKNGSALLKALEELRHLKKFELQNYKGDDQIWKEIFSKYSG